MTCFVNSVLLHLLQAIFGAWNLEIWQNMGGQFALASPIPYSGGFVPLSLWDYTNTNRHVNEGPGELCSRSSDEQGSEAATVVRDGHDLDQNGRYKLTQSRKRRRQLTVINATASSQMTSIITNPARAVGCLLLPARPAVTFSAAEQQCLVSFSRCQIVQFLLLMCMNN